MANRGCSFQGCDFDFTDPKAVMQLTKTLLQLDFNLKLELPENRLCPPVCSPTSI